MTDSYLSRMLGVACDIADAQGGTLFLVDGDVLRPYLVHNLPPAYILGIGEVKVGTQCCGRAVAYRKPWIVTDMLTDPLFADGRAGAVASPIRAAFSVPVMDEDTPIGSLACHFTRPHRPTPVDIERNEVFARLFAISLRTRLPFSLGEPLFSRSSDASSDLTLSAI